MALSTATLVFLATFSLAVVAVWIARMVMERLGVVDEEEEQQAPVPSFLDEEDSPILLREAQVSSISLWAWLLERFDFVNRLKLTLAQADLNWTVGRVTASMLLAGAVGFAILSGIQWLPVWGIALLAIPIAMIPHFYIVRRKNRRWEQIEEQFPDAIESMSRALRAGHPFASALDTAGNQTPNPLGRELRKTFAEGALGLPWERALENLTARLPMQEVSLFAAAVQMQSRSGGNLSEVLDKLSENMREGAAIRGEVRSLSAQGRAAGYILTALPAGITIVMMYVNPTFLDPLFQEEAGRIMLLCAVFGLIVAHLVIRKLVDIRL
ncbi:MAG: type II secretion system F family protein [Bryobacterales bacterium]|nr:type II secretion system F family protein [Bryobacterales bacterium]